MCCWALVSCGAIAAMFYGATAFNQPLDGWVVSSVTNFWVCSDRASLSHASTRRDARTCPRPVGLWVSLTLLKEMPGVISVSVRYDIRIRKGKKNTTTVQQ